jgi:cyanate permease
MRFVPVKTEAQQAVLTMHRTRDFPVRQSTQVTNAIRAHLAEFGIVVPKGVLNVERLLTMADEAALAESAGNSASFSASSSATHSSGSRTSPPRSGRPPLMLQVNGWRSSHLFLGLAIAVITVPLTFLIPRRLQRANNAPATPGQAESMRAPLATERWAEALNSSPLWLINAGYFVCGMTVALFTVHLIPFATDRGYSPTAAAFAFGLLAVCSAIGSLLSGTASDRLGRKNIMALAYLVRGIGFMVLLSWRHEFALYVFAVLGGLSWLATPITVMALTSEVYGMKNLATLGGVSLLVHQIGGGASVWLAGELHDLTGSYDISFTLATVALVGATLASYLIDERRYSIRYVTPVTSA